MAVLRDPIMWHWLVQSILLILLVVSAATDLLFSKLFNKVTVTATVLGIVLNSIGSFVTGQGFTLMITSLVGWLVGFGIMLLLFFFGGIGGGDVKLMGAIGALGGYPFILWAMFFSALSGGLISMVVMIYYGQLWQSFKNVGRVIYTFVAPHKVVEPLNPENSKKIPLGFGISIGTIWCWVLYFLEKVPS